MWWYPGDIAFLLLLLFMSSKYQTTLTHIQTFIQHNYWITKYYAMWREKYNSLFQLMMMLYGVFAWFIWNECGLWIKMQISLKRIKVLNPCPHFQKWKKILIRISFHIRFGSNKNKYLYAYLIYLHFLIRFSSIRI